MPSTGASACAKRSGSGVRPRKLSDGEIADRVEKAADIVGLRHLLERAPCAPLQQTAPAGHTGVALVRQPAVFLFDEPLSNIEGDLRGEVQSEIVSLHRRVRTTVVYVTHDQGRRRR
jgi:ABC-type sugar transport system ATPase subunit